MTKGETALEARVRAAKVPRATRGQSIVLATWNVRELGRSPRRDDSIRMITRILSSFTLVSLVELRRDTRDLERIFAALGPRWRAVYSDPLEDPGANEERACFLFDTRHVRPTGLVSVVHRRRRRVGTEYVTPHPGGVATALPGELSCGHARLPLRDGARALERSKGRAPRRAARPRRVGRAPRAAERDPNGPHPRGRSQHPGHQGPAVSRRRRKGARCPEGLLGAHGTNLAASKRYDQILHLPVLGERFTQRAGVVDFFSNDLEGLYPRAASRRGDLTREMSDHLPLWAELAVGCRAGGVGGEFPGSFAR